VHQLFATGRIGAVELRNRIVMPAMATLLADRSGAVSDKMIDWYAVRARGGAGLVTVENAAVEEIGRRCRHELGIYDGRFVPGLRRLADRLHAAGARCSIQLGHAGARADPALCGGAPFAPSAIPYRSAASQTTVVPQAISAERIAACIEAHLAAAHRAAAAGFDIIELPACGDFLIAQFLKPAHNRRADGYGGTLENRARILLDLLRALCRALPELPVVVRLDGAGFVPGGIDGEESVRVARWVAAIGAAAVHVSSGPGPRPSPPRGSAAAGAAGRGGLIDHAGRIAKEIAAPVIAGGGLADPAAANAVLVERKADFVALGRGLIADPEWPRRAAAASPVRRCIGCGGCLAEIGRRAPVRCVVNPWAGRETELPRRSPLAGERIGVIGAGPAGLSYAACVAGANDVTVFERAENAGGAFVRARLRLWPRPGAAINAALCNYIEALEHDCRSAGVRFCLATDPLREPAMLGGLDRIVVATGAAAAPAGLGPIAAQLANRRPRRTASRLRWCEGTGFDWRRPTGPVIAPLLPRGAAIEIIGDARRPGRAGEAIAGAVMAALFPHGTADRGKSGARRGGEIEDSTPAAGCSRDAGDLRL
jgi:2,4-dienoyl-CoA reductase-like NADH-dependent reductase (Old Yellow Enzyme family)